MEKKFSSVKAASRDNKNDVMDMDLGLYLLFGFFLVTYVESDMSILILYHVYGMVNCFTFATSYKNNYFRKLDNSLETESTFLGEHK